MPPWPIIVSVAGGLGCLASVLWAARRRAVRGAPTGPAATATPAAQPVLPPQPSAAAIPSRRWAPDPFIHGSASERRRAPRRPGQAVAVLVTDDEGEGEPMQGMVLDRSQGGLRLLLSQPVPRGQILRVRAAAVSPPFWVRVLVRHCRETDTGWEVGCRFVQLVAAEELWRFE